MPNTVSHKNHTHGGKCVNCARDYLMRRRKGGKFTNEAEHLQRLYGLTKQEALKLIGSLSVDSTQKEAKAKAPGDHDLRVVLIVREIKEAFTGRGVQIVTTKEKGLLGIRARIRGGGYLSYDPMIDAFYVHDGDSAQLYDDLFEAMDAFELVVRENEFNSSNNSNGAEAEEYSASERRKIGVALRAAHRAGKAKRIKSTAQIVGIMLMFDKIKNAAIRRKIPAKGANAIAASQTRKKYGKDFDQAVSVIKASRR